MARATVQREAPKPAPVPPISSVTLELTFDEATLSRRRLVDNICIALVNAGVVASPTGILSGKCDITGTMGFKDTL